MQKVERNNYSKKICSLLQNLDLFAQEVQLRINKNDKFFTPLGIIMSLILITLSLILAINNIVDVIQKTNPSVVSSDQQEQETPNFILMPNNFTFVISVNKFNLDNIYGLDTLFSLQFTQCYRKRDTETRKITQEYSNFEAQFQKAYFQQFNKSNIYCINQDEWIANPFSIQGSAASNEFRYLKFNLLVCQNKSENNTCYPKDYIQANFPGGLLVYYVQDQLLDLKKPEEFFVPSIRQGSAIFAQKTQKTIIAYHKTVYVQTDVGLFIEDLQERNSYQNYLEKESSDAVDTNKLIEYVYQLDPRQTFYNRSYPKIQDIIGTIGGLWQAMYFIISILIMPFIQGFMELSLINKFFTFSYKTNAILDDCSISQNRSNLLSPPQSKSTIKKSFTTQKLQIEKISDTTQIAQFLRERKTLLKLNLSDLCGFIFGSQKKQRKQFEYSQRKILQKLDITFILHKLFEIDKLKMVLFTENQLKLFNYFPKPCVSDSLILNSNDKLLQNQERQIEFSYLLKEELTHEMKVQEAYKAYKKIKKLNNQEQLDQRILIHLDQDLRNLFDSLIESDLQNDSCNCNYSYVNLKQTMSKFQMIQNIKIQSQHIKPTKNRIQNKMIDNQYMCCYYNVVVNKLQLLNDAQFWFPHPSLIPHNFEKNLSFFLMLYTIIQSIQAQPMHVLL
ncbi:unnamed protein product (macronuclear) [Paramecium tetraurelia]|uniref:Chromosome undetermined scaffold_1, whole genome shotgun sequence n=1 Tax=Paramecium tetraurelia TaxID=5888 RepID=Q6BFM5_PARTE|nr:hypothetical protein [Paramecium tetraurelia strain d4-2]XP_001423111.1 uncharacterized protein GSPATT00000148001 [Paramecium tetraurelia]CAH03545.1 hypothetical protein, transmembrane helices [Paramecium tetraurelia]CAK55713.1 unnamed protein product [Paramecium tetraurelia]|eukprot:XP_001423111.1 hypothetical protein (macronuclear) [Paramecium tetraurelia strain d4-2]